MKAWIKAADGLELTDTDPPVQGSDELLVRVGAISLNRGEVRGAARAATGAILGWDIAGTVEKAAPNGAGPAAGTRVAALLNRGGWAELASVPLAHAAVIPDGVSIEEAATLPIYGLLIFEELESRRVTGRDLERLLELVRGGRLRAPIEVRRNWTELDVVLKELEQRAFNGKAVLEVERR